MAYVKATFWTLGLLGILTGFALAAADDYTGLSASEYKLPALPSTAVAQTVSEFEIKAWPKMVPGLVENNTVRGKLIAVPYFVEISLLYYRRDLLGKYHFVEPPRTWNELEQQ